MNHFTKETKMNVAKRTALFLLGLLFLACGSGPVPAPAPAPTSPPEELDAAIRETSDYLNKQLPKGNKLVILNIQSDYPALSEYIIDELIANTVNDRIFSVVDRQQLDTIRAELDFQTSGEVDDETAQALGRLAGAQSIVSGAVSRIGDLYRLRVRALSVQTAQIEGQFNRNIPEGSTIAALVKSQATGYAESSGRPVAPALNQTSISGSGTGSGTTATPTPASGITTTPVPSVPTYRIGDIGPAGGWIFYDKGQNTDGWRYLEVAPAETEFTGVKWGGRTDRSVPGTNSGIGTGKRNTELIVGFLRRNSEGSSAAQLCDEFSFGGYEDWFLPSKDELDLMYTRLKSKGLGELGNGVYWSSTEVADYHAWSQSFRDGTQYNTFNGGNKSNSYSVRAVRAF